MHRSAVRDEDFYSLGRGHHRGPSGRVKRQETFGWRARSDTEPWIVVDPIDWTANPYDDKNWLAQFHGWRMMDAYLVDYRVAGDASSLHLVVGWMLAWREYRRSPPPEVSRTLDPASGMRATRIAIVLDAADVGDLDLSASERDGLRALAREQAEWLVTPGNIVMMNHAYFQVLGLELLCRVLSQEPWAAEARAYAIETFDRFVQTQFTDEGVHVENTPSYHFYALDQIRASGSVATLGTEVTRPLVEKAETVMPWLVFPDGRFADVGDNAGGTQPSFTDAGEHTASLSSGPYAVAPFWRSGYAIVRSLPDTPPEQASMLFVAATSRTHIHSHADKLSFELYEFGRRVIVDSGKYGYTRDPMRTYVESAAAHNTVALATDDIRRLAVSLEATQLEEPTVVDDAFRIAGSVRWTPHRYAKFTFDHQRQIDYHPARSLTIEDRLESPEPQSYVSRLHLDRTLVLHRDGRRLHADFDAATMHIELLDEDCELLLHHGSQDPIRGWQSVGYLQMEPTTTIEAVAPPTSQRTITWRVTFDRR